MDRSNVFDVECRPALETVCSTICGHGNELIYRRQEQYFDDEGDVWNTNYKDLYEKYKQAVGGSTAQQIRKKNDQAWRVSSVCSASTTTQTTIQSRRSQTRQDSGETATTATKSTGVCSSKPVHTTPSGANEAE